MKTAIIILLLPLSIFGVTRTRDIPITSMATLVDGALSCAYGGEPVAFMQEGAAGYKSRIVLTFNNLSDYIPAGSILVSASLRLYNLKPPVPMFPQTDSTALIIYNIYNETAQDPLEVPEWAYRTNWAHQGTGPDSLPNWTNNISTLSWFIAGCGKNGSDTDGVANVSTDTAWVKPSDTNSWVELNLNVADVDTIWKEEGAAYPNYYGWVIYSSETTDKKWGARKFFATDHYETDATKRPVVRVVYSTILKNGFRK